MAERGWYEDPSGQMGMYRYWDGQSWSDQLSPTPLAGPPATHHDDRSPTNGAAPGPTPRTANTVMWVTLAVVAVVVALVVFLVIRMTGPGGGETGPGAQTTTNPCPRQPTQNVRAPHPTGDGKVYGGALSYPRLARPWSDPVDEWRMPFGRDMAAQWILIHGVDDKQKNWGISVMVGELYAGDGFYDPQQGSEIVNKCIFHVFYDDHQLGMETLRSDHYTVDGYEAWITETRLTFSIPNLASTSELAIVIIVKTSAESSSIFYASIPNDAAQYRPDVDQAIAGLHVVT